MGRKKNGVDKFMPREKRTHEIAIYARQGKKDFGYVSMWNMKPDDVAKIDACVKKFVIAKGWKTEKFDNNKKISHQITIKTTVAKELRTQPPYNAVPQFSITTSIYGVELTAKQVADALREHLVAEFGSSAV